MIQRRFDHPLYLPVCVEGKIAFIAVPMKGSEYRVFIDEADAKAVVDAFCRLSIVASKDGRLYASGRLRKAGTTVLLHRWLIGCLFSIDPVDHIDGDGLNNRRGNLRVVSNSVNALNVTRCVRNKHGFRGVVRNGIAYGYSLRTHGTCIYRGGFSTARDAAIGFLLQLHQFDPVASANYVKIHGLEGSLPCPR